MTDEQKDPRKASKRTKATRKKKMKSTRRKKTAKGKASSTRAAWTFPKNSLEDALLIARAIEDKNAGNPMNANVLVKAVGHNQSADWRFLDLLRSANQYGLVTGTGANATVSLDLIGVDVVAPSSSAQRQQAPLAAFRNVDQFRGVEEFYGGKRIPEDEFFENTVIREFSIPRDRVKVFTQVFTDNQRYLNLFNARPMKSEGSDSAPEGASEEATPEPVAEPKARVREFLDTCFMMMAFGSWFDRYYQDIDVPAIRDAGFEPVRGNELFTTGSVVEQIWEQVEKSTVLLADLRA